MNDVQRTTKVYMNHPMHFLRGNLLAMHETLGAQDRREFNVDWQVGEDEKEFRDVLTKSVLFIRKWLFKEDIDDIDAAQRKHMWSVDAT